MSDPTPPPEERVSLGNKVAYGAGAFAEKIIFDTPKQLASPIYNVMLGVPPNLVGIGLFLPRVWDALCDPVIGIISDKTQSRWGRRRPFIFIGAILTALAFIGAWSIPRGHGSHFYFLYFLGFSLLFYTAVSVWSVPYQAMGFELATGYRERTRVQGFRAFFNACGNVLVPWIFFFTQLPFFGNPFRGLRFVALGLGVLIGVLGILPALLIRERPETRAAPRNRLSFWSNLKSALRSRPFQPLVLAVLLIQTANYMMSNLGFYVAAYYLYPGNMAHAGAFLGTYGTMYYVMAIVGAPAVVWLTNACGKRTAFELCCVAGMLASALKWYCFVPEHPYLAFVVPVLLAPSVSGISGIIFPSMVADICDVDELECGLRREGTYGAVSQWILKLGQSLSFLIAGVILTTIGFEASRGTSQADGVITAIRAGFAFVPAASFAAAIVIVRFYPLTEARAGEVRRALAARAAVA